MNRRQQHPKDNRGEVRLNPEPGDGDNGADQCRYLFFSGNIGEGLRSDSERADVTIWGAEKSAHINGTYGDIRVYTF
jgi:hypothetical protein